MALATCAHPQIKGWYGDSRQEATEALASTLPDALAWWPPLEVANIVEPTPSVYHQLRLRRRVADYDSWHEERKREERLCRIVRALLARKSEHVVADALSLEQRFQKEADRWEKETALLSATPMRVMHDSYQSIIAMGPEVVPILLRDLQKTRRHWFWALRHLTGVDPVPAKDKGNLDRMIAAWVDWGRKERKA